MQSVSVFVLMLQVVDQVLQHGSSYGTVQFGMSGCSAHADPIQSSGSTPTDAPTAQPTAAPAATQTPTPVPIALHTLAPASTTSTPGDGKSGPPTSTTPKPKPWPHATYHFCKVAYLHACWARTNADACSHADVSLSSVCALQVNIVGTSAVAAKQTAAVNCVSAGNHKLQMTGGPALLASSQHWEGTETMRWQPDTTHMAMSDALHGSNHRVCFCAPGVVFKAPEGDQYGSDTTLVILPKQHSVTLTGSITGVRNTKFPALALQGPSNSIVLQSFTFQDIQSGTHCQQ